MKMPEIGSLIVFNNRVGIVREFINNAIRCEGIKPCTFFQREFYIHTWDFEHMFTDIETKSLYEFEQSIGENVYDSHGYARNCRIIETTKNASGRYGASVRPEYWVKAYNPETDSIIWLVVDRYEDGILRWGKHV